jgi:hypothetical protein
MNFVESDVFLTLIINVLEEFARPRCFLTLALVAVSSLVTNRRLQSLPKNIVVSTFQDEGVRGWDHCL